MDLPQDFCGSASLGLRYADSIKAADNGAGSSQYLSELPSPLAEISTRTIHVGL